jgi:hypothetical protein
MVNAPKTLTTSLGCLGALLTVVIAFSAFFTATEQAQLPGERVEAVVFSPDDKTLYGTGSIHSPALYSSTLQA